MLAMHVKERMTGYLVWKKHPSGDGKVRFRIATFGVG